MKSPLFISIQSCCHTFSTNSAHRTFWILTPLVLMHLFFLHYLFVELLEMLQETIACSYFLYYFSPIQGFFSEELR
jgi:hypothetical protein